MLLVFRQQLARFFQLKSSAGALPGQAFIHKSIAAMQIAVMQTCHGRLLHWLGRVPGLGSEVRPFTNAHLAQTLSAVLDKRAYADFSFFILRHEALGVAAVACVFLSQAEQVLQPWEFLFLRLSIPISVCTQRGDDSVALGDHLGMTIRSQTPKCSHQVTQVGSGPNTARRNARNVILISGRGHRHLMRDEKT